MLGDAQRGLHHAAKGNQRNALPLAAQNAFAHGHGCQIAHHVHADARAARVAHGGGLVQRVASGKQQAAFFAAAGGSQHHIWNAAQKAQIIGTGMGGAVCADDTGAVDGKQYRQILQCHVVHQLVVGALQEGGVNCHHGLDAAAGQAGSKGHRVLLGNADIEIAFGKASLKLHQSAWRG